MELDAISVLSAKVDAMSQKAECLNVNSISSSTLSPSCETWGSIDHFIVNCQVRGPFAPEVGGPANYVNNFNPRLTNNPFLKTILLVGGITPASHIFLIALLCLK